jgi:hypothetical protein
MYWETHAPHGPAGWMASVRGPIETVEPLAAPM